MQPRAQTSPGGGAAGLFWATQFEQTSHPDRLVSAGTFHPPPPPPAAAAGLKARLPELRSGASIPKLLSVRSDPAASAGSDVRCRRRLGAQPRSDASAGRPPSPPLLMGESPLPPTLSPGLSRLLFVSDPPHLRLVHLQTRQLFWLVSVEERGGDARGWGGVPGLSPLSPMQSLFPASQDDYWDYFPHGCRLRGRLRPAGVGRCWVTHLYLSVLPVGSGGAAGAADTAGGLRDMLTLAR